MSFDLQEIKDRIHLPDLFRRDGHVLRRAGAGEFTCCPFHEEKSGSCKVEAQRFHCFGCGAGTDCFDYWERSRGVGKKEAIAALASIAGLSPDLPGFSKAPAPPRPRPQADEIIPPLDASGIAAWLAAVDELRRSPSQIMRIAKWRGYSEDVVRWAVDRGIIGLMKWSGIWREAFLVEMPVAPAGPFVPVTVHIRLGPHTRGNDKPKASWRFDPPGRGAWPLVFGELHTATHIFLIEGQWDALALIDLMGWHRGEWPAGAAVVAMRGASSFRKLLAHYAFHEKATAFAIADADNAGKEWFMPGGFVEMLGGKVARTYAFWPGEPGLDLNDLLKRGLSRPHIVSLLAPKLRSSRHARPTGPTFLAWCRARAKREGDPHRAAAAAVVADTARPSGRARLSRWERHWKTLNLPDERTAALRAAWDTYRAECTAS